MEGILPSRDKITFLFVILSVPLPLCNFKDLTKFANELYGTDISPEEYASYTFTWITTADLPNADIITSVKSIVSDEWGPGPEVIVENIHIDNENGPQLISQDPIKIYPHPENSLLILKDNGKDNEIYNIGNDYEISILKLINLIKEYLKIELSIKNINLTKGSAIRRCPDLKKNKKSRFFK